MDEYASVIAEEGFLQATLVRRPALLGWHCAVGIDLDVAETCGCFDTAVPILRLDGVKDYSEVKARWEGNKLIVRLPSTYSVRRQLNSAIVEGTEVKVVYESQKKL